MVDVEITIPGLLRDCAGGRTQFTVRAATVGGALQAMLERYPLLRIHLYDEQEQLRRHLVVFYNEENIAYPDGGSATLRPGDRIQVLQAVSGGVSFET